MTDLLFRDDAYLAAADATVTAAAGPEGIELDRTIFYASSGGQPGDTGRIDGLAVTGAVHPDGDRRAHPAPDGAGCRPAGARRRGAAGTRLAAAAPADAVRARAAPALGGAALGVTGGAMARTRGGSTSTCPSRLRTWRRWRPGSTTTSPPTWPSPPSGISEEELAARPEMVRNHEGQAARRPGPGAAGADRGRRGHRRPAALWRPPRASTGEIGRLRIGKIEKKGRENRRVHLHLPTERGGAGVRRADGALPAQGRRGARSPPTRHSGWRWRSSSSWRCGSPTTTPPAQTGRTSAASAGAATGWRRRWCPASTSTAGSGRASRCSSISSSPPRRSRRSGGCTSTPSCRRSAPASPGRAPGSTADPVRPVADAVADSATPTASTGCRSPTSPTRCWSGACSSERLFERGVVVVTTSNRRAGRLSRTGSTGPVPPFHRARRGPAGGGWAERRRPTTASAGWPAPGLPRAARAGGDGGAGCGLDGAGRRAGIVADADGGGTARGAAGLPRRRGAGVRFAALCGRPLGPADYLALAAAIEHADPRPRAAAGRARTNEAKRFVILIDALYEARVRLISSDAAGRTRSTARARARSSSRAPPPSCRCAAQAGDGKPRTQNRRRPRLHCVGGVPPAQRS